MQIAPIIKLVECPRDAMQGWKTFILTSVKIEYLNTLLQVGFDTLDCGSFVSPKAIPQMADTKEVIRCLNIGFSTTKLLVIVANVRGATEAVQLEQVRYLGFPFSISETFQLRNTNSTIDQSFARVEEIQKICAANNKELVIYLSMGFGNPYGDEYNQHILLRWADEMVNIGVKIISLADTVGLATPAQVGFTLEALIPKYSDVEIGVHLHSTAHNWQQKLAAAVNAGCKRFDGALKGIGGCPMANDELVGNMDTGLMINYLQQRNIPTHFNMDAFQNAVQLAEKIFI